MSYYKRSNIYWELDKQRGKEINKYSWQDDYPAATTIPTSIVFNLLIQYRFEEIKMLNKQQALRGLLQLYQQAQDLVSLTKLETVDDGGDFSKKMQQFV